ncbi:type II toxin-antitoxin system VapC family toxin [Natrinema sp. 1APR25-10V2]|uniref:type II toxin-antitoxin system VapC family toxin n=1 Tax=Natrinema sp. 1APR25-10V2 TaxID=2951081 RepID=UPI0028764566|nr:type II toxin-antitoxin system VapC family toxin [Natrinema sp. 1APR25-10V2]MDS0475680.1 type II toxin-antitoxin system VapC family toxin [Natrinema sp. 1APR25-10V2]
MTVLIDTGVLYADHDRDASRHATASDALEAVYSGTFGQPYVSDYLYDEAVTLTLKRSGSFAPAQHLGEKLRGIESYPQTYEMLRVSAAVFADAVDIFDQYDDHALSFTDATSVALCRRHDLDGVMSFDNDFDGIVRRIDPATV